MAEVSAKPNFPSTRASRRWRPDRQATACPAGLALAMTAAGAAAGTAGTATAGTAAPASPPGHLLSPLALGLNTAPWDYVYAANTSAGGGVDVIQPLLQAAGIASSATAAARTRTTTTGRPTPTSRPASGVTRSEALPAPPSPRHDGAVHRGQLRQHRLAALRPVLGPGQGDRRAELRDRELRLGHAR